jgi:hypothetical protein
VSYASLNKESHVLEVPEGAAARVPATFSLVGHRKGFKRYSSDALARLVAARGEAEEGREAVQAGVLRVRRGGVVRPRVLRAGVAAHAHSHCGGAMPLALTLGMPVRGDCWSNLQ